MSASKHQHGFTLAEAVVVIVVVGVISAGVALFMRTPIEGYLDAAARSELSDTADTALRRIMRELQGALPNSVRLASAAGVFYLEFLPTRTGGRYRSTHGGETAVCPGGTGDGDVLAFGAADTCFRSIGDIMSLGTVVTGSDFLVLSNTGNPGGDAYASGNATGGNKSLITAVAAATNSENQITFQSITFPFANDSPAHRFHIISGPVTFSCGGGTLQRYSGYAISSGQPKPPAGAPALLANNVSNCTITYDISNNQRTGVVSIWLQLAVPVTGPAAGAGTVSLFQQAQVSNVP
jgi:MSHA biogenesis protein MshO